MTGGSGEVRAIHERAIEDASEGDRRWFENAPNRRFRLRDVVAFEFNQMLPEPPQGTTNRVLVARLVEGARVRLPLYVSAGMRNEDATEEDLAALFDQYAPAKIKAAMRKDMGKR